MQSESLQIISQDGLKLNCLFWDAVSPKAVLCIIHGLGEHAQRYEQFAEFLTSNQIAVFALDLRGHGLSAGKKGHAPSMEALLNDVEEMLKLVRSEFTELPIFLFGHSMGGNIVISYIMHRNTNELKGFIASAPYLKLAFDPPQWKLSLAKIMVNVYPRLTQPSGLNPEHLSRNPTIVQEYIDDPLVHPYISAKLYDEIMKNAEYAISNGDKAELPGLVYHGSDDQLISIDGTHEFARKAANKVKMITYDGGYHEPHHDLEYELVYENVLKWIKGELENQE